MPKIIDPQNEDRNVLAYDTETTDMPVWKEPSDSPGQPHIVQLAATLRHPSTGFEISSMNVIIKPDGWKWDDTNEAFGVHGITYELAMDVGIPESLAVEMLIEMSRETTRVAYGRTFDQRIIRIGLKRYFGVEDYEAWGEKDDHPCAMLLAAKIMKAKSDGEHDGKHKKLGIAYNWFTGKEMVNAHNAKFDADACADVYLAILKMQSEGLL